MIFNNNRCNDCSPHNDFMDSDLKKPEHHEHHEKHHDCEPTKTVFECKNVSGAVHIPIINLAATPPVPRTLGTISADLHCFSKPCVKLDFTALLVFGIEIDIDFNITFRVFKQCGDRPEIEIDSFDFARFINVSAGRTEPIVFSVCDCDTCPSSCCTYRIAAEGSALAAITGLFSVTKGVVSITAVDQCPEN